MSEVKVNKITPTTNCGTVTLGDSGDTIAIPAGVNLTSGGALTNSGTITNTGSITGVSITGTIDNQVNWQTDSIKTTGFTAVAGEGYFCNTTSAAFTVTLPASPSAGDLVGIKDYANTADTNNITIGRNGSNIEGVANDFIINIEGGSITLIYVDATKGWLSTAAAKASDITEEPLFITATGGTITCCGDYKIHTFTGPGTFTVTQLGNFPTNPNGGPSNVDYLTVAGGGSGGTGFAGVRYQGGGGAGGYRTSFPSPGCNAGAFPISATAYPITVGAGGASPPAINDYGRKGSDSIFSTITSTAGGAGGFPAPDGDSNGGSGGGGGYNGTPSMPGGAGNTPPVSPPQGNNGGSAVAQSGGGGGGASAVGGNASAPTGGNGGAGSSNAITGSATTYAGGGGGGGNSTPGSGGSGGGGAGHPTDGVAGTANTGGGGGGTVNSNCAQRSGAGGSGIVIIRYKFQ